MAKLTKNTSKVFERLLPQSLQLQYILFSIILFTIIIVCTYTWLTLNAEHTQQNIDNHIQSVETTIQGKALDTSKTPEEHTTDEKSPDSNTAEQHQNDTTPTPVTTLSKITIIVTQAGVSHEQTALALTTLPKEIVFSFSPYSKGLKKWEKKTQLSGHETLISTPMEPRNYPRIDAGPQTLLINEKDEKNLDSLDWISERLTNHIGYMNFMGKEFMAHKKKLFPIFKSMKQSGLIFVENTHYYNGSIASAVATNAGLTFFKTDLKIDKIPTKQEIGDALESLEELAHNRGYAIGTISLYPSSIKALKKWSTSLKHKNIELTAMTDMVKFIQDN